MKGFWRSRWGWILTGGYLVIAAYLIVTQGLFGTSFIAIVLGMPWSVLMVFIQDWWFPPEGSPWFMAALYSYALVPILLNASVLYLLGWGLERLDRREKHQP